MASFPPPPTYAPPVIVDKESGQSSFNPIWLSWFIQMTALLEGASSGSIIPHNNLLSIQGGVAGEYYHFTAAQHSQLVAYDHEALNGLLGGAASDHYHLTNAQHTLVTAYQHNSLNGLQGGAANEYYHFTQAQHTLITPYDHEDMNGLLGGAANEHYHLTQDEHTTATAGPAEAVTNIVVGASPFTWQNTTGFNVVVAVSGLAGDAYDLSRDNAVFYPIGVGATLCLTVPRGDYLRVTYGGAAPTLDYFAM